MKYLKGVKLSDRLYAEGELPRIRFVSASTDEQLGFGVGNELGGGANHNTPALGFENKASDGGLAAGYWSTAAGEDRIAVGCGAKASGQGWANNAAIGRRAAAPGNSSVQPPPAPANADDRKEGRDYNILSANNTFRFRGTTTVASNGKIPAASIDPAPSAAIVEAVLARLGK